MTFLPSTVDIHLSNSYLNSWLRLCQVSVYFVQKNYIAHNLCKKTKSNSGLETLYKNKKKRKELINYLKSQKKTANDKR